jgi:hypothetical protein
MLTAMHMVAVQTTVSGTVRNGQTGKPLAQVSVQAVMEAPLEESGELQTPTPTPPIEGRGASVVTNDDGVFTLKSNARIVAVVVSAVGYATQRVAVGSKPLDIRLQPATVQLREVTVWTGNARELVMLALQRIADNYSAEGELAACFYRETAMKRQHYVYVAEGVVDMYKGRYSQPNVNRDRVAIRKGRRLMSPKRGDTLTVKVTGGPVQSIMLDIVKNRELLLNPEELEKYDFQLLEPQTIDDRQQLVVGIEPRGYVDAPYALYHGRLYIDHETLAITRAELELDMNNREKATSVMLVRKPAGLRFRPRELSLVADYRMGADGRCRLSYVRTRFRFNCDWKRRLFATSFTATCELVVTDREAVAPGERPITGRQSFDSRDAFYDKVDFFRDPDFWRDYNIIEPTESLDRAIDRLLRRYK